jgi:hypothetical protein
VWDSRLSQPNSKLKLAALQVAIVLLFFCGGGINGARLKHDRPEVTSHAKAMIILSVYKFSFFANAILF